MTELEPLHALNLDINQQQIFVNYYRKLPEKQSTTVRFFNRTDYYTVHDGDALIAAESLFNTQDVKYMGKEPKLSYLVLSRNNFEKFVRELLLVRQYSVEVYVKYNQNNWLLEYKGSPGNLTQFEEILFESNEVFSSSVMGIKLVTERTVAISCVDTTEGYFYVSEFDDNECYTELEALLAQINPKECLIPQGESPALKNLSTTIERNGILISKVKKTEFNCNDIIQDLNRLLFFPVGQQQNAAILSETTLENAMASLQAVIKYLNLTADEQYFNQFKIKTIELHTFVRLDSAACYALNVFPKVETNFRNNSNKYNSVFGVLDSCSTSQGRRMLMQWLKQPLRDINLINERLEIVEALVNDTETRETLSVNYLNGLPDLMMLAKKLSNKKCNLRDCYRVYQTIGRMPGLLRILKNLKNTSVDAAFLNPLTELLTDMEKYMSMIEQTIDMEFVDRGEFLITPNFCEELKEIHERKQKIERKLEKVLKTAAEELDLVAEKSIKLECSDQHGYLFRITSKEEPSLRQNKSFSIVDSQKNGVRFTNSKLSSINKSYLEIKTVYEEKQQTMAKEIFDIAAGYADTIRSINIFIAKVDVLVSFAKTAVSASVPYVKPKMHKQGTGILKLKRARHPCLEIQDGMNFIPNDVDFNRNEKLLYIITGPNMGGKSTYIRSVGISVLFAHVGSFVPCEEAEISLVDGIFARIGAEDSQLRGLSTFMMEMVEATSITKSATADSLIIIDELGRGTSTYDGCGIAWAIAEYIATTIKCFALFATHFNEITGISDTIPTVGNLHVTAVASDKTITSLYQIREGACDNSYGIQCARLAGFPEDIIEDANERLEGLLYSKGLKYIKDYEPSLKKKMIDEGNKLFAETIEKCKRIKSDQSDEELMCEVNNFKSELLASGNLYVKAFLE